MTITNKDKLLCYMQKIKMMSLLCSKSEAYCNRFKNLISVLLMVLSTTVALLNSTIDKIQSLKTLIIVFNFSITIIVGFEKIFRFNDRSAEFRKLNQSFTKLSHDIDKLHMDEISDETLSFYISIYDNILDNSHNFPSHILRALQREYADIPSKYKPALLITHISPILKSGKSSKNNSSSTNHSPPVSPIINIKNQTPKLHSQYIFGENEVQ